MQWDPSLPSSIVTVNDGLLAKAALLRASPLFVHPCDPLAEKQALFLSLAGWKPVSEVVSGHWEPTESGRRTVPDDPAAVGAFLEQLGLACSLSGDDSGTDAVVSLKHGLVVEYQAATDHQVVGRLLGYPSTAALAFPARSLPLDEQERIEEEAGLAGYSVPFAFSRSHWRQELRLVTVWVEVLRAYGLLDPAEV